MTLLILGLLLFLGIHSVSIVAPAWRDAIANRMGLLSWKAVYSLIAIAGFVLLWKGYALARLDPVPLYARLADVYRTPPEEMDGKAYFIVDDLATLERRWPERWRKREEVDVKAKVQQRTEGPKAPAGVDLANYLERLSSMPGLIRDRLSRN